jgi:indolepyruvate ferredoxin oxidoreductase
MIYFEPRHKGMKSLPPTPMGAEGVPWIGLSPFVDEPHLIQNLGDGTLSHSGTLAIRACVAAGVDVTFKILYNATVAMTGGQDVTGLLDIPSLTRALEAEGVRKIVVCSDDPKRYGRKARWAPGVDVLGRDRLPEVQEQVRSIPGVTVIVYDQQCAAEARRLRKRGEQVEPPHRVVINEAVCEGCGDCGVKSNCLSVLPVDTEFGQKRRIHDLSCNRDYTCLEGDCPSFVTLTPKRWGRRSTKRASARDIRPSLPAGTLPAPATPDIDGQFGIYFTGIGGTGVVTANRILAAAAEAAGFAIGGVDQTGLSQKAGAVVSHLHLATDRSALGAATISAGGADLYLSGDILQAASPRHLERVEPGRTIAVIDREITPTGAMLQTDSVTAPAVTDLEDAISATVGADRVAFVDSQRIAETVFANPLLANIVLLGAAFQLGGLPLALDDIEQAMQRQGRTAADNLAAFTWGRWVVHDRAAVESALASADGGGSNDILDPSAGAMADAVRLVGERDVPAELRELLTRRAAQVIDYDDRARAARYLELVGRVNESDDATHGWALTRAVAEAWFKLLTYKDEYEVARLHLKVDYDEVARELGFDGPYKVTYHLHPPVLRRRGMMDKLPLGKPSEIAFPALRRMKRLRGTPLDVFGWDPDRRMERALIGEYEQLMDDALRRVDAYDDLVGLAESPLSIKGYGPIKERAAAAWRAGTR